MRAVQNPNAKKTEERLKYLGDMIFDAILDDDPTSKFNEYIDNPNQVFMSNYKLPSILQHSPPLICVCCFFGAIKCFRALIDLNADPLVKDQLNYSTAHFVAFSGNLEIARDLYNLGVDFQEPADKLFQYMPFLLPNQQFYPQHIAAMNWKQDFINWLWLKGCKIDKTLLIYSSAYGNMETIKFLFDTLHFFKEKDEDNDDDDDDDDIIDRAINSAAVNGQDKALSYLIKAFPKINLVEALVYAARNGSLECVKICYKHQKKQNDVDAWESFLNACSFGHLDIVLYLIKLNVKPSSFSSNSKFGKNLTPLACAVNNNHYKVAELIIDSGYADVNEEYMKENSDKQAKIYSQQSASQSTSNKDDTDSTKENDDNDDDSSNSNDGDDDEDSFIIGSRKHYFFDEDPRSLIEQATMNDNLDMIKLIKNAFDMDIKNLSSIANIALRNRNLEITDYFVNNGVSINDLAYGNFFLRNKKSKQAIKKDEPIIEYFISKGILENEELPLYLVYSGDLLGLTYVLDRGGELNESYINKNINQIMKESLLGKHYEMIYFLLDNYNIKVNDKMLFDIEVSDQKVYYDLIKHFIDKGISLSTPKNGHSLLYYAILNNNLKVIELLKENGADFTNVCIPIYSFQYSKSFDVLKDIIDSDNDFSKCEPKGSGKSHFITQIYYHYQNKDLLKYLFKIGFIKDVNKKFDEDDNTLLDFALYNEDIDTMIFLLNKGASLERCNSSLDDFDSFAKSVQNKILSELINKQIESYYSLESD